MSGIYIHIPYCKQACHYCDFHFSTNLKRKEEMVNCLIEELQLRKHYIREQVDTIYFGGGTPSLISDQNIRSILDAVGLHFNVVMDPEITLEANPDDITESRLAGWKAAGINRISLGVQSFDNADLKLMNRAHDASMARDSIKLVKKYFENFSIDLIYGMPDMSRERWQKNYFEGLSYEIPHLSAYALTVEPGTALSHFINKGIVEEADEALVAQHFYDLVSTMESEGYEHYEISNFGKPGFYSQNNVAYWKGVPYLGIGPSAHSFNGSERAWNVKNNKFYIEGILEGKPRIELEVLYAKDRYNETIMTGLRTQWGVSLSGIEEVFGILYRNHLEEQAVKHIQEGYLQIQDNTLKLTKEGKFLADGIASDLFIINLKRPNPQA